MMIVSSRGDTAHVINTHLAGTKKLKNHKLNCKGKRKYTHTVLIMKHQFTQVLMSG